MKNMIEFEVNRIVGQEAVKISDVETEEPANRRVRLETTHKVYELPANRLIIELRKLPDKIGVEPFCKAIEDRFPSVIK